MLVRLGAPDSVPAGLRIVRAARSAGGVPERSLRALPGPGAGAAWSGHPDKAEPVAAHEEPSSRFLDARLAERVREAYRASELIQPRPGLILRVRA